MTKRLSMLLALPALIVLAVLPSEARTIRFSGYDWNVRPSGTAQGPGPNNWDESLVQVDENGYLHLSVIKRGDQWYCSEVSLKERLGYGRYQFWIVGRMDQLDPNVVVGLFNYPTADVGPDGTHEIDIEFARWGNAGSSTGNYTVWPNDLSLTRNSHHFSFTMSGDYSTQRFNWSHSGIYFQSLHGHRDDNENEYASWMFQPSDPMSYVSQRAMPVNINLWLFQGKPPVNGQPVELIVRSFKHIPECL